MAINSKNTQMPQGTKYKVSIEKMYSRDFVKKDFVMLYDESKEQAAAQVEDTWGKMGWKVIKTEEA